MVDTTRLDIEQLQAEVLELAEMHDDNADLIAKHFNELSLRVTELEKIINFIAQAPEVEFLD